jgi:glycerol-3-phosphate acyltransferase PlsY
VTNAGLILAGYLAGSMPFGYWVVRLLKGVDIRKTGSGNIGATNVWRTYGKAYGIPVVVLDVAKGFVPTLVAVLVAGHGVAVLVGGAAMLGHTRPIFLRFARGGKAVATCGGALWALSPLLALIGLVVWITVFLVARYASLASMVAAVALPVGALLLHEPWPVTVFVALAAVVVLVLHRANIARLRAGTENRFELRRRSGGVARPSRS